MDTKYYAYLYIDIDNTPIYAGKGCRKRAWVHFNAKSHLGNILRKRKDIGIELNPIIYYCESEELAFFVEEELIRKYGRKCLNEGTLLNITSGGEGGCQTGRILSEETKAKMSKSAKNIKRHLLSDETKAKMSKSHTGRILSEETKLKIAESNKGKKHKPYSEETKLKLSMERKGKPWSEKRLLAQLRK